MSTIELKEKLIDKISKTNDDELLKHLSDFFDFDHDTTEVYKLSPEERAAVRDGMNQIDNGSFFTNEEANKIIDKCLGR